MRYLFDTNAISEVFRRRPNPEYVEWLQSLPSDEQFTSVIVLGELYSGAFHSPVRERWLALIEREILPSVNLLGFSLECAKRYGELQSALRRAGTPIGDVDTQIAATALTHELVLVTAKARHFRPVPGLQVKTFVPGTKRR